MLTSINSNHLIKSVKHFFFLTQKRFYQKTDDRCIDSCGRADCIMDSHIARPGFKYEIDLPLYIIYMYRTFNLHDITNEN